MGGPRVFGAVLGMGPYWSRGMGGCRVFAA